MATRILPDWIDAYLDFTNNSEPPTLFKKWTAISVIASCLQRKCVLPWGTLEFFPNMYIVLVAPSGKCRKGTAMGPGYSFLRTLGINVAAEAITREALIRELAKSSATHGDQALGKIHNHCSLTIFSKELTVFLGYNNTALMSDLTDWYDCSDRWTYRTKNSGEDKIVGVWVNLIGATTPELIQTALPRDAIGGGLTSRIIFVFEDKKSKLCPAPFLTPMEEQLRESLRHDLEIINMMTGEFRVTDAFVEHWVHWYRAQDDKPPFKSTQFSGYFERRPNHVLKLCMIVNASRTDSMIIDEHDLQKAISILTTTEIKMPRAFGGVGRNNTADVIHRIMTQLAIHGTLDYSDLLRQNYHDVDKETFEKVIATLEGMKYCRIEVSGDVRKLIYLKKKEGE
jgi:hypothetical protein